MTQRFWRGFAAYLLPTFPLGYCWHLVVFAPQYHALRVYREEPLIPLGLASMLVQAVIFSWAYPRLFSTERKDLLGSGIRCFAVYSALSWSFTTLAVGAKSNMTSVPAYLMLETAFTLLQFAAVVPLMVLAHATEGLSGRDE